VDTSAKLSAAEGGNCQVRRATMAMAGVVGLPPATRPHGALLRWHN
jgi:hypothetical protein